MAVTRPEPTAARLTRRSLLGAAGGAGLAAILAACAPQAAPPAPPSPGGSAGGDAAWQQQFNGWVDAAKREGKLVINIVGGNNFQEALDVFKRAYPGIEVEQTSFVSSSLFAPRVIQERKAGLVSWDVSQIMTATGLGALKPEGVWEPIRPALVRPEVTGDQNWQGGFDASFPDTDKQLAFLFSYNVWRSFVINTDVVKEGELKSVRDLLDPKWKGKLCASDPRTSGPGFWLATVLKERMGEGIIKQLYVDQQAALTRDSRQLDDWMVRGNYPIAVGLTGFRGMREFLDQGLGRNLKLIELPEARYAAGETIFLHKDAPHPNAARVFINWMLSKEGQEAWSKISIDRNSRRTDVSPMDPEGRPVPGERYLELHREEMLPKIDEARAIATKLLS